jgi:mono/diheme cytochrome c family protein
MRGEGRISESLSSSWRLRVAVTLLVVPAVLACDNEQRSTPPPPAETGQTATRSDTAARPSGDTVAATVIDTGVAASPRRDSAPPRSSARKPSTSKPATAARPRQRDTVTPSPVARDTARPASADTGSRAGSDTSGAAGAQASGSAPLRDQYHQAPRDTVSQEVYDGWKQYNLNCARCHGEDVLGTTIAPHLIVSVKPDGPINTKELFNKTVCDGRPEKGMPAWCPLGLDMEKIQAIYAYVKGRSEGAIHPGRPALRQ